MGFDLALTPTQAVWLAPLPQLGHCQNRGSLRMEEAQTVFFKVPPAVQGSK